jgi:NUDIX domain
MFKKIKLIYLLPIIFTSNIFSMEPQAVIDSVRSSKNVPFNLATYDYRAASVLPIYKELDQNEYVILTREIWGKDKGTYDDFSGGRNEGEMHPIETAAREFYEEGILHETLGWDLKDTENFIDPQNSNTLHVIVYSKDRDPNNPQSRNSRTVTYIVNLEKYGNTLLNNFYDALNIEKIMYRTSIVKGKRSTMEKDFIASVQLSKFKEAIINNTNKVEALIINPETREFYHQEITLRPFLIAKLRPYFLNMPYERGENEKIRHYKVSR